MKFVKIENRIVNIAMITHLEIYQSEGAKIFFAGDEPLRLDPPASEALIASLNATEIHLSPP